MYAIYKIESEARDPNRTERETQDESVPAKLADFLILNYINLIISVY